MRIFNVYDGGCDHYILAESEDSAHVLARAAVVTSEGDTIEFDACAVTKMVDLDKELAFHADEVQGGIKHTARDWLTIYRCMGEQYLACSEW